MAEEVKVVNLTEDQAVARIGDLAHKLLTRSERHLFGQLMMREPLRAQRVFNERFADRVLSEEDVARNLREIIRVLSTAGDA